MSQAPEFVGKDVLITGGLGFIGSNVARRLVAQGARVTLCDSLLPNYGGTVYNVRDIQDRVSVALTDVRDSAAFRELVRGKDYLFNLAGQTSHLDSMTDPQTDLAINTTAQLAILEACRAVNAGVRIVFASTRQVYGRPQYLPVDEHHPIRPVDVNGINKLAGEWYHLLYNDVHGIRSSVLRLTNTYGPGMRVRDARQSFIGLWCRQVLSGETVRVFGDGEQRRDFNHVDDCVDALLLAARRDDACGRVYNLGSNEVVSLRQVAEMLIELEPGARWNLAEFPPSLRQIDIGDYHGSYARAHEELGWSPRVPLMDGLRRTLAYYREHRQAYWGEPA